MYLQGNLQAVFDVLYDMGVIEPVLKMDWKEALKQIHTDPTALLDIVEVANRHQRNQDILKLQLKKFDDRSLSYLAMEVAREFADFHSREDIH
jgi:hypothetical protein